MSEIDILKSKWKKLYQEELPTMARLNQWPVYNDHCIARIIYDFVAGQKWDNIWKKPALHNISKEQLEKCIFLGLAIKNNKEDISKLNQISLGYRNKI